VHCRAGYKEEMMSGEGTMGRWFAGLMALIAVAPAQSEPRLRLQPATGSPISVGAGPTDVALSDFDGDGRLDVAAATRAGVVVLLGDGRGGFAPAGSPLAAAGPPHLVAAVDLDRDGRPDLAATSHDTHDVSVWRSTGAGRFVPAPGSPVAALSGGRAHNHGLAIGDLDGDGWPDLTTADDEVHVVAVLLGGPAGLRPRPGRAFAVGNSPYPHALGDLDGDGRLDAVVPNTGSASVTVLLGDGRGGFAPGRSTSVAARPFFVALGDVDGDRSLDAVVTHDDISRVTVLRGDGRGGLTPFPGAALDAGRRSWKAALGDLDRDGRLDLALGAGGRVVALAGDGHGRFTPFPGSPFAVGRGAWSLALGDVDADGRLDVVTADLEDGTLTVLLSR
jgi:hypothetical protein